MFSSPQIVAITHKQQGSCVLFSDVWFRRLTTSCCSWGGTATLWALGRYTSRPLLPGAQDVWLQPPLNLSLTLLLLISNSCTEAPHLQRTGVLVQYLNVFEMGPSCERGTKVLHCVCAKRYLENRKIFYVNRVTYLFYYRHIIFVS